LHARLLTSSSAPLVRLGAIKQQIPGISIMALTATATPVVVDDIKKQLRMDKGCLVFTQSGNRPNLKYEVRKKDKKVVEVRCC